MPSSVRIYLAASPVDFRGGFDRLVCLVRGFGRDASSGHLFVFLNRRGTQTKILFFDRTGYVIVHKRLERGKFSVRHPIKPGDTGVEIDSKELGLMLEGVVLTDTKQMRRWVKK